ncbi:HK97 gp10 family phage protein [Weizmannia coagulans]|nr:MULTISPECIES: HK97 gp10 family phage protein [Heyndrickxia]MCR4445400.1 HK97 gp10 family phage protein [Heyndrickxia coagulans]MCW8781526.1 HK97 gp10 family phage protein [Heyndrickxia coagulans]MDL4843833.1 HK97 gp10 family phage protein [Heyndrickxia coagulans]UYT06445.1 HK97 gp10 family phage protein [Weizmannia sp. WK01]UYT06448.1 HK97 gp10 family phage protein [Weizmannia sp. WK01]
MNFNLKIDKKTAKYFQKTMPHKLTEAKNRAVEAMGKVWADETKELTRNEGHIQTGLYVNSIGYNTGSPASDGDVIHKIVDKNGKTILETGSNVAYAGYLEKKYNLMARGLDISSERMQKVAKTQIKDTLFG